MKYCWGIITLLLCNTAAVAQHYKKVGRSTNETGYVIFDSSGTYNLNQDANFKWCSFYAKSNGEQWFYYDGFNGEIRSESNNSKITNGTVRKGRFNPILQLTDSTYLIYHYFADRIGIEDTGYIVKTGTELEIVNTTMSLEAKGQDRFVISRISKYKYLLVTENSEGLANESFVTCYLHVIDKNGVRLTDSITIDTTFFTQPIQWGLPGLRTYDFFASMILNNNASKLYLRIGARGRYIKYPINKQFLDAKGIVEIEINTEGKVTSGMKKLRYKEQYDISLDEDADLGESLSIFSVSPSNKILYFTINAKESIESLRLDLETTNNFAILDRLENDNINISTGKSPYGQIYQTVRYLDMSKPDEGRVIHNANEASSIVRSTNISPLDQSDYFYLNYRSPYDYMKLYHSIDYDCGAAVRFQNKTDQSAGMDSFTWYFTLEDGSMDTLTGFEPSVTYTKSGDYFYKVLGLSQEGREYGEWYIDTLKIRIPPKPVAKFIAKDTIVCAYSQATFINQSTTDTVHQSLGEKWVWTFGDGTSKTVLSPESKSPVSHSYKTPGTYTVSLFYSNGFCDSTLTKNQYIKVVDAPAPGFTVDNIRGCSPFTVNVTDTVTKNTIRKEYNYYDGRGWIDVPLNQANFSQTYPDAGTYWITQRLYGYTGCVTQLDSVQVFVTPGFTAFDTSHITNATYQDIPAHPKAKEIVTLTWPCLEDAAVRYDIYRNAQKIESIVADSVTCIYGNLYYDDSLVNAKTPNTYTVLALDSCGTATQLGRVGQPVHLTGEVVGNNELSIIRYTAYQDWNVGAAELSYDLQTEAVLGDWKTLKQENSTAEYRDYQFLDATKAGIQLEKCYRVIARLGGSKSTISNILCLPYSPVIFIPTAFSPNGDNLNDVYRPITFGITHYTMSIYDRYGQKVAELNQDSAGWDAADYPMGTYMVTLRAKGTDSKWYNAKETVTVVR